MPVEFAPVIAVVDDDPDFQALLVEIFDDEGYAVAQHTEADTGLPALRRTAPDLIVLDLRLERPTSGWELLRRLRAEPDFRTTPIIVCSADEPFLARHLHELHDQGCAALPKPFDLDHLLALVAAGLVGAVARLSG
jgi:DNA-binding response OmpR family regulator